MHFRFNTLPKDKIYNYLESVLHSENLSMKDDSLLRVINFFEYDIRSMINYLQINQHNLDDISTLDDKTYLKILNELKNKSPKVIYTKLNKLSAKNNTSIREIIRRICYIMKDFDSSKNKNNANIITYVLHDKHNEPEYLLLYILSKFKLLL